MTDPHILEAALLTPDEMAEADRLTIEAGVSGIVLMENAARLVADAVVARYPDARRVAFLAGPGNNGGDAFAAARLFVDRGGQATVYALVPQDDLSGDAAKAAAAFDGPVRAIDAFDPAGYDLIVDGLFGAGLSRAVEGSAAVAIAKINEAGLPVVAVDLPSGVSGSTGAVLGEAVRADLTVTFFRRKPGHLLEPGRSSCGEVVVGDIGIADAVLDRLNPRTVANEPGLWLAAMPSPAAGGHKYDRGHCIVFSGGASTTGAARLAATAALRAGAGLVTLATPGSAVLVNAAHLTAVMLSRIDGAEDLSTLLEDDRLGAFVLGPGFGVGEPARTYTAAVLTAGRRLVLDADGISSFAHHGQDLFVAAKQAAAAISGPALVLTPHAGEFSRLFPDLAADDGMSKLDRARAAADRSGAIVVLKGADTVIAAPDGRAAINAVGTPWLATAGTGDVLAGIVAAQLAQGMKAFEAACAAVWMHGRAAELYGPGLISEDLPAMVRAVVAELCALER